MEEAELWCCLFGASGGLGEPNVDLAQGSIITSLR